MNPLDRLDAALLALARKIVNVWSRATGKTNFALARLTLLFAYVCGLLGLVFAIAAWDFFDGVMSAWWVLGIEAVIYFLILPELEEEVRTTGESETISIGDHELGAALAGAYLLFLVVVGFILTMLTIASEEAADTIITFTALLTAVSCQCASLYFARCFDKGGKSKVVEWTKAVAQKVRALGAVSPKPAPVPIPIRN